MPETLYWLKEEDKQLKDLMDRISQHRSDIKERALKLEAEIEAIPDAEVRVLARKRFIENKDYEVIGRETFMDRRTVSRKLTRWIQTKGSNH